MTSSEVLPAITWDAIWRDHYQSIVDGGFRDRAGEMLELSLADGLKTKFRKALSAVEGEVAAAKRKVYLEELTAKIRATKTNSPACPAMSARAASGEYAAWKNWLIVPRLIGSGNTTPLWFVYTRWT